MGTQPKKYLEMKKKRFMYKHVSVLFIKRKNKKLLKFPVKELS